jgi:integrase
LPSHKAIFNMIVINEDELKKVVESPKSVRNQIIFDLPRLEGLRTREMATLKWSHINFEDGVIWVLDSKKHVFLPLPLDWRLANLLLKYKAKVKPSEDDYVLQATKNAATENQPISNQSIEYIFRRYAKKARVWNYSSYNPRLFRAYFAAKWIQAKRSFKILQLILRHNNPAITWGYVNRIVFWKDVVKEFDQMQTENFIELEKLQT